MSNRIRIEDTIYRAIYGLIFIVCLSLDISNFPDTPPSPVNIEVILWNIKISLFGISGVFMHIFMLSLMSLDIVVGTGIIVILIWLAILLYSFVFDTNKTHNLWFYIPISLMPLSGGGLIAYGMKFKVAKNEK